MLNFVKVHEVYSEDRLNGNEIISITEVDDNTLSRVSDSGDCQRLTSDFFLIDVTLHPYAQLCHDPQSEQREASQWSM